MTKLVSYHQSNRLTQGVFHEFAHLHVALLEVPRTFGQDCSFGYQGEPWPTLTRTLKGVLKAQKPLLQCDYFNRVRVLKQ